MTWPIVEGTSLLFLRSNRGKRSITPRPAHRRGRRCLPHLVKDADVVVEAMRRWPRRRGLGYEDLKAINPRIVFIMTISGYGMTGPYKDYPATDRLRRGPAS